MNMNIDAGTVARTACLALALTNQLLNAFGVQVLPIADEDLNTLVTTGFTVATSLAAWLRNNGFSTNAIVSQNVKKALDAKTISSEDVKRLLGG